MLHVLGICDKTHVMTTTPDDSRALKVGFDTLGYCVVDGLWTPAQIDEIERYFEDYKGSEHRFDAGSTTFAHMDKTKQQVRAMLPHRESRRALEWLVHPPVAEVLALLLGRPALGAQTMYYFKPPGSKGQGMHQDNFYLLAQPATCIAAWTAIDDADLDNGCLYVVPGSHRGELLCPEEGKARWQGYGDSHITRFPRETAPVPVKVRRGQTMFFGGNLIHGSGPNRTTDRSRRTFIGHYVNEATEQLAKFYHPLVNMRGETVSAGPAEYAGGGACGDGWAGAVH